MEYAREKVEQCMDEFMETMGPAVRVSFPNPVDRLESTRPGHVDLEKIRRAMGVFYSKFWKQYSHKLEPQPQ